MWTTRRGRHAGLPLRSKGLNYYGAWSALRHMKATITNLTARFLFRDGDIEGPSVDGL
jgi:hypothetical protein